MLQSTGKIMKKIFILVTLYLLTFPALHASVEFIAPDVYIVGPDGKTVLEDIFTKDKTDWKEVSSIKKC